MGDDDLVACIGVLLGALLLLVVTLIAKLLLEGAELLIGTEEATTTGVELGRAVGVLLLLFPCVLLPSEPPPPQPVRMIVSKPVIANSKVQYFLKLKIILTT
jgi:hypothetical protein